MDLRLKTSYALLFVFLLIAGTGICQETEGNSDSLKMRRLHELVVMKDGIKLSTDIFLPNAEGKYPVILVRTPYKKKALEKGGLLYTAQNYVLVTQDCRGKFESEGHFYPFINEREDGLSTVDWIRKQPWCNGKIGGFGGSYVGYTQWAIADVLDCITPELTSANMYDLIYPGGAFSLATAFNWGLVVDAKTVNHVKPDKILNSYWILPLSIADDSTTKDIAYLNDWLAHEQYDEYWENQNHRKTAAAPMISVAGWYDIFLGPQIEDFQSLDESVRNKSRLIIGPWCHGKQAWENDYGGGAKKGNKKNWMAGLFNEFLKDEPFDYKDPVFKNKIYNLFVMGRNEYYASNSWPPKSVEFTPLYLGSDNSLTRNIPSNNDHLNYTYNPTDPFLNKGGTFLGMNVGAAIQNDNLTRKDQLIFDTDVLESDLILLGPLSATLYASSDAPSTDFYISLHDVMPNDTIINIQEGGSKVRMTSGINKIEIDIWATGYQLNPGHKLRVVITSSLFPRYNRNLNSGEPIFTAAKIRQANQTIYFGEHPSSVTLPILKWKEGQRFEE